MQIGQIIRKYRKEHGMTQEEMANRLGVTAPAVNKWENGNSMPDISLLGPIARLLDISLDTLLSFREELTSEEITDLVCEADTRLKTYPYDAVFRWAKAKIEEYPNCLMLAWQLAVILDARLMLSEPQAEPAEKYEGYILDCYKRVLKSKEEQLRTRAADSLFSYHLRKEHYKEAEQYLTFFSEQNPERKRKQAVIFSKTGRREEAYRAYEELLFSEYQMLNITFHSLYLLAMEDDNQGKAHKLVEKQRDLAELFEMGRYHAEACQLELATKEQDAEAILACMEAMLESVDDISGFCNSFLYEHMIFRDVNGEFKETLEENLKKCFCDEETYGFLKGNPRWRKLVLENSANKTE